MNLMYILATRRVAARAANSDNIEAFMALFFLQFFKNLFLIKYDIFKIYFDVLKVKKIY